MEDKGYKYVFRGTTIGFGGNTTSNRIPSTSATYNPAKALLFALSASYEYKRQGIVYIADTSVTASLSKETGNCFESYEEEIGFSILPGAFQALCIGYVSIETMREALLKKDTVINFLVHPQNLSSQIKEMRNFTPDETNKIVQAVEGQIKKD